MEHVQIKYGSRTILKDLDWEIKNGEKWALFGPNGAGKSTLLSLVYADNPQSYANTFYLFDRKRGSGESIWEIKRRIGYVSPEMHLYYQENVPTLRIVGSGFFDSVGLFRKCTPEQEEIALEWMKVFGIGHLRDRLFLTLSSGEQRLALLARAFVKDGDVRVVIASMGKPCKAIITVPGNAELKSCFGKTRALGNGRYEFTSDAIDSDVLE